MSGSPEKLKGPEEGFWAACTNAGKEGWKLAYLAALFNVVGIALTMWMPELVGALFYRSDWDLSRAAQDGRLATLALQNVFALLCLLLIIPSPRRRQQYPFLYLFLAVAAVLSTLTIAATLPRPAHSTAPNTSLIILLSWLTAITTTTSAFFAAVAKSGEENILKNWNYGLSAEKQDDEYEKRVGGV